LAARVLLAVVGVGLICGGVVLAAQGTGLRGGRSIGAVAIVGVLLVVLAWQARV